MGNIHNYASNIKYDNTKTDFTSETVQDMLDEIASRNYPITEQMQAYVQEQISAVENGNEVAY